MHTKAALFLTVTVTLVVIFLAWDCARAQNFIDPIRGILRAVEPGMAEVALRVEIQKMEQELPKRIKVYSYGGWISILWEGDEILGEVKKPTSNLFIQLREGRVECVWFRAFHFDPFKEEGLWDRGNKGPYTCNMEGVKLAPGDGATLIF